MTMTNTMSGIGNVVQMHNYGETKFRMPYGREWLEIQPGEQFMCTREIAAHFLGRWWTDNTDPKYRERAAEVHRLRTLYGAYEDSAMWERNKPCLALFAPNGESIQTVVDDPDGLHARPLGLITNSSVEEQIAFMQGQLAQLLNQQMNREGMPPPMDASMPPPPPPPHTPGPQFTNVPGAHGAVPLAARTTGSTGMPMQPASPVITHPSMTATETGTQEFDDAYLADLASSMPEEDGSAILDDIVGDAVGTRLEPDAREIPLEPATATEAATPSGPPVDNPAVMKTGPGRSQVKTRS